MNYRLLLLALLFFSSTLSLSHAAPPELKKNQPVVSQDVRVPILLYHRFGPTVADGMTITTTVFESHLKYLRDNGYKVIPLRRLVDWYQKKGPAPAPKSVVIVEDDAHKSVYTEMLPLAKKYNVPVTVFIYPSAISNAKYAMTWDQIRELKKSGLFDFQGHTYWHPNFKRDKKKMTAQEYEKSVVMQLTKSKAKIEKEVGTKVDMLAWPFGIFDDDLLKKAADAGYVATFTIQAHHAGTADSVNKLPRYLLINSDQGKAFAQIVEGSAPKRNIAF
ncbi:MAG: polysaccharide deacetylase family protein [Deltaproteobacteria bacterium]|nr:polysaccharide deacetylase family protein [Deltaproteobacteria bacterium]